jgi:ubiquinone/menaquinone biosynthesis C-methylase UbiE
MSDLDAVQESAAVWDSVAESWEQHHHHVATGKAPVTASLLGAVALRPGHRVLEVGAGTGELAAEIAPSVAPGGEVVATDVSPAMVDIATRRLADVPCARAAVADLSDLTAFDDFDAVLCRMGIMFLPEPTLGFAQLHRALRDGGRMGVAVWAAPEHNPWLSAVGMSAVANGLPVVPPFGPGGPFSLAEPDALATAARDGGFADVHVEAVDLAFAFPDAATHVAVGGSLAPNLAPVLAAATDEQRAAVAASVAELDAPFAVDGGLRIPGRALVVRGRR